MKRLLMILLLTVSTITVWAQGESSTKVNQLAKMIDYHADSFQKKIIFTNNGYEIILFSFQKGQGLPEHKAPVNSWVQIIDGEAEITIDDQKFTMRKGETIVLPKEILHTVKASKNFKMLLVK
jgi:quercetin dioxygenase-like cupin family protein